MARANLQRALEHVFGHEGGLSLDPNDRGNWTSGTKGVGTLKGTKFGIAAHSYPNLDIRNLTLEQAAEIYRRDYWNRIRGDLLVAGFDVVVFDAAVNSGPGRAIKWMQKSVGTPADGDWGPATDAAIAAVNDWVGAIKRYCAARLSFLQALTSWTRYGRGWARRVAENEAFAVELYLESIGRSEASIAATISNEAAEADDSRRRNGNAAKASGGATAADGVVAVDQVAAPGDQTLPDPTAIEVTWVDAVIGGAFVVGLILVAFFLWRAHAQKQRRDAYNALTRS